MMCRRRRCSQPSRAPLYFETTVNCRASLTSENLVRKPTRIELPIRCGCKDIVSETVPTCTLRNGGELTYGTGQP